MIYFIPWVVLIVAAIVAVPIAAKMSPSSGGVRRSANEGVLDDSAVEVEEGAVLEDEFATGGDAEPLGDDAFEEFK